MTSTIEQVPWKYESPQGPTYYRGTCEPVAVCLHRSQGYYSTAREWAMSGYARASWHYSIDHDGSIMQHLTHADGGYHAGIAATAPTPTWSGWQGHGRNVNAYTLGVEMMGFAGDPHTPEQLAALKWLCQKLAGDCGFAYARENFPAHAEIDVVNRVNDFNTPEIREEVYKYLFEEEAMTPAFRRLQTIAWGVGEVEDARLFQAYDALVAAGFIDSAPVGGDALNQFEVRRYRIAGLSVSDAADE